MYNQVILLGQKLGYLTIVADLPRVGTHRLYQCRCVCGTLVSKYETSLRRNTTSCGSCMKVLKKEYMAYAAMIQRCHNEIHPSYKDYGARGIKVCEQWRGNFQQFFVDIGRAPAKNLSIGRIKNDLGYFPGNVEWQTTEQQNWNKRPPVRLGSKLLKEDVIAIWYSTKAYQDLAAEYGVHVATISDIKCRKRRTTITKDL